MARKYRRDNRGRFAGSGGGGGGGGGRSGSKGGTSTAARKQAVVREVSSAALKGGKTSNAKRSYARAQQRDKVISQSGRGKGNKAAKRATAAQSKAAQAARSQQFSSKATSSKAKARYKAATSAAREANMLAGGRTSTRGLGKRTDAGAKNIRAAVKASQAAAAKVRRMERNRR